MSSNDGTGPPGPNAHVAVSDTYSVFARFRRSRLVLMRRLPLREALSFAIKARRSRFHDTAAVFICSDRTGEKVDERHPAPEAVPAASVEAEAHPQVPIDTASPADLAAEEPSVSQPSRRDVDGSRLYERAERCLQRSRVAGRELRVSISQLSSLMEALCRAIPSKT